MNVLVLNCGGSSVKFQLIDMPCEQVLAKGQVERIGKADAILSYQTEGKAALRQTLSVPNHAQAIQLALDILLDGQHGAVHSTDEISAVGHRVVHGGDTCMGSVPVTSEVVKVLKEFYDLAPLHNPPNVQGIEACLALMPHVPMVAVFDSSLHQSVPPHAYTYAIPYEFYKKYRIRRYGFHGITFRYMTQRAAELLQRPLSELRIVNLMLGSGTTACAFRYGHSVDVSTGLTPTEGLVQSTRCGDIDPLVVTYLMRRENLSPDEMDQLLNKESGWLGISGVSNDLREVTEAAKAGNTRAQLAIDAFVYRCKKYIGAYAAAMGGIDALVFSGGVGEKSAAIRTAICSGLDFLGISVDPRANESDAGEKRISRRDASVDILVVPTNEEIVIARDTYQILQDGEEGRLSAV